MLQWGCTPLKGRGVFMISEHAQEVLDREGIQEHMGYEMSIFES